MFLTFKLKRAADDLRMLLSRSYPKKASLELVGNRYSLSQQERHILYRVVFSKKEADERKNKLIPMKEMKGKKLIVDGYNVLILLENALRGKPVFLSDDGFLRDAEGVFKNYKPSSITEKALELLLEVFKKYPPQETFFFFDAPITRSRELARHIKEKLLRIGLPGEAVATRNSEFALTKKYSLLASSDSALINQVNQAVDIPKYIIKRRLNLNPIKLR